LHAQAILEQGSRIADREVGAGGAAKLRVFGKKAIPLVRALPAADHDVMSRLAGYGLGVPTAFWFVQRLVLMTA